MQHATAPDIHERLSPDAGLGSSEVFSSAASAAELVAELNWLEGRLRDAGKQMDDLDPLPASVVDLIRGQHRVVRELRDRERFLREALGWRVVPSPGIHFSERRGA